jgi:outer membrane protein assembly factor BamB
MLTVRRLPLVVLAAGVLAALPALLVPAPAAGQGKKQPGQKQPDPPVKPGVQFSAVKLVENSNYQRTLDDAIDAYEAGDWDAVAQYLNEILTSKEDFFAKVETKDPQTGQKSVRSVSVKFQANALLSMLPPKGLAVYEEKYGTDAKKLLDQAKQTGNRDLLAECAYSFLHTKAGAVANDLLATWFLDRGDYFPAALRFERIIGPDAVKSNASDLTIFKAVLAFNRAGETKKWQDLWQVLQKRIAGAGGLKLADNRLLTVAQIENILKAAPAASNVNPHDWPVVAGNLARNAQAKGSPPMLDYILWSRPTIQDISDETKEAEPGLNAKVKLQALINAYSNSQKIPVMSGGFPIATNGQLFYRTYNGITAVYLKDQPTGEKAGQVSFRSTAFEGALATLMEQEGPRATLDTWIDDTYHRSDFAYLVFENSTVGTLTTDNRNVYAVDDLAVPAPPKYLQGHANNQGWQKVDNIVKQLIEQNTLWAFNIESGKIEWKLGGSPDGGKTDEFAKTHFICAPISVGGKLYVLNEKNNGDLRLVCIDPIKGKVVGDPQKLGTVVSDHVYMRDLARRVNAIHLAYGEGILVCPTNAGEIFGVDLTSRSLAWAYPYRQKTPDPRAFPKNINEPPAGPIALTYNNWKVAPPVIVDGKVVFTAPDSEAVHCISLRDGNELWKAPRHDNDVFFAGVFGDKVLIVGKNSVRAVRLADGAPVWNSLSTGDLPSGQGVASNNIYYLPLRGGEVLAIDLNRWAIQAHNRASKTNGAAPGNLVFYEGAVLSQTPTAIVAYPQLSAKKKEAEIAYAKNPSAANLLLLGELRLADGQTQLAVDDLEKVLKDKDLQGDLVKRARNRLHEALTDLLQADFNAAAPKYLKEYQELCSVPDNPQEQLQREAKYQYIVATGREAQRDLVAAFDAYRAFAASPLYTDGVPSIEDPQYKVPTQLWLRGRINSMFEKAQPQEKVALEKKIATEWVSVKEKGDLPAIRQFTAMFDIPFQVGREARLELANVVMRIGQKENFLEAELNLEQLRVPSLLKEDSPTVGKALEALARLELAKGSEDAVRLAAAYFRIIHKEFAQTVLRDGKTGADLFNALAEDPRIRPYLEEPGVLWANAEIRHKDGKPGEIQGVTTGFFFQPEGDLTGPLGSQRLVLDPAAQNAPKLSLVDVTTNKLIWTTNLGANNTNYLYFQWLYDQTNRPAGFYPNAKFRFYQAKGHLGVIQVGMVVYGIDMDNGQVKWSKQLYDPTTVQPNFGYQLAPPDEHGRLWVLHQNQFGGQTKVRVGQIGAVQATYVALATPKGLVVLDPIKGTVLWSKPGLSGNLEVFGDDQYIYYVEVSDNGATGAGRCLRASDGVLMEVPDFSFYYRHHLRIMGRHLLTAEPGAKAVTMRLYDVQTGKSLWKHTYENDPVPLMTEDPNLCGVIERETGKISVVDLRTFKEVLSSNVKQGRVSPEDLKELHQPWLLEDNDRFYVALNARFSATRLIGNMVSNNFSNGTRCIPVNGWFCAIAKNGEFLWHGSDLEHYRNQMLVVEQFKTLPVLLFTSRFQEMLPTGGVRTLSRTGSLDKATGKAIWWSPERDTNGNAQFYYFTVDLKQGTINMIGYGSVIQFYAAQASAPK